MVCIIIVLYVVQKNACSAVVASAVSDVDVGFCQETFLLFDGRRLELSVLVRLAPVFFSCVCGSKMY